MTGPGHRPHARRWLGSAAAAIISMVAVSACSGPSTHPAATFDRSLTRALVADLDATWATDGHAGFFVPDNADRYAQLSPYASSWWASVAAEQGTTTTPVAADAGRWIRHGVASLAIEPGSQPLEDLAEFARYATAVHAPLDAAAVGRVLARLQRGVRYAATTMGPADLAATAQAVSVLTLVKSPAVGRVRRALAPAVRRALTDRDAHHVQGLTVPMLAYAVESRDPAVGTAAWRRQLDWLASALTSTGGPVRLSVAALLTTHVGSPPDGWTRQQACTGVTVDGSGATIGQSAPEPHLTENALRVGCLSRVSVPPATRTGWPGDDAVGHSLTATVAALRVAREAGLIDRYRGQVEATFGPARPTEVGRAELLEFATSATARRGYRLPPLPSGRVATLFARPDGDTLTELAAQWLVHGTVHEAAPAIPASVCPRVTLANLVSTELVARLTGNSAWHSAALRCASDARTGEGRYGDPTHHVTSLYLTLAAGWVRGTAPSVATLVGATLCDQRLHCRSTVGPAAADDDTVSRLEVAAGLLAADSARRSLPFVL